MVFQIVSALLLWYKSGHWNVTVKNKIKGRIDFFLALQSCANNSRWISRDQWNHILNPRPKEKDQTWCFWWFIHEGSFSFLAVKTSGAISYSALFFWLDTGLRVRAVSIPQSRESSIIEDYDLWKVLAHELYITDKFSVSWPPATSSPSQ